MTHTSVISQSAMPAEPMGGHARDAGRDSEGDSGFEGLLSSLVAGREKPTGQGAASEGGATSRDLERRMAAWLTGDGTALEGEGNGDPLTTLDGAPGASFDAFADATDPSLLSAVDASEALAGTEQSTGANISAAATAAAVARVAGTSASSNQPGAGPTGARPSLPTDVPMPSEPGTAHGPRGKQSAEESAKVAVATATVVGQETHLAPVREAAVIAGHQLQKGTDSVTGQPPTPDTSASGSEPKGSATVAGAGSPHPPATAKGGQNAGTDARSQQGREHRAARQASAEAHVGVTDARSAAHTNSEQVGQAARTDAQASVHVGPSGPLQQIAARIASEVGMAAQAGRPDATGFVPFAQAHLAAPVRVLQIQLQPAELGTVTVRISLKDQALRLDVEVGRGDTAQLLQRERDTLSVLLRSAGYLVDGMDIRMADLTATGQQLTGGDGQAGTLMPGDGQGGSSQADGRSQHARQQDQRRDNPFGNGRSREDDLAGTPARRGDLYV